MKYAYFVVLTTSVFFVLVGIVLQVVLVANGRGIGGGMYMTTSRERAAIGGRDVDNHVGAHAEDALQDVNPVTRNPEFAQDDESAAADSDAQNLQPRVAAYDIVPVVGSDVVADISRPAETIDISVAGSRNTVTIRSGTKVNFLSISGTSHSVTIEEGASLSKIRTSGTETVIVVPGIDFEITGATSGTKIIRSDTLESQ